MAVISAFSSWARRSVEATVPQLARIRNLSHSGGVDGDSLG